MDDSMAIQAGYAGVARGETKSRSAAVAFLLSLVMAGLGQLYNAQPVKAAVMLAVDPLLTLALLRSPLPLTLRGTEATVALILVCRLLIGTEAAFSAWRIGSLTLTWYTRWYVYLAVFLAWGQIFSSKIGPGIVAKSRYHSFYAPSTSMQPTLDVGDFFMVDMWPRSPERGDIVVFSRSGERVLFVKRVVGLEGDTVAVSQGRIVVNGSPLAFPVCAGRPELAVDCDPVRVPPGSLFVVGDTLGNSEDSRMFGPIRQDAVTGRALYIFWPWHSERLGKSLGR